MSGVASSPYTLKPSPYSSHSLLVAALPDSGQGRRVLDLGGLVSPRIVPLMQRMDYDAMVRSFAFREAGRPAYLVDRGPGPERLRRESPFGPALTPLFSARTQSLGITKPDPVDYTLYRVDWAAADSIAAADPGAAADSGAAAGGPGPAPPR